MRDSNFNKLLVGISSGGVALLVLFLYLSPWLASYLLPQVNLAGDWDVCFKLGDSNYRLTRTPPKDCEWSSLSISAAEPYLNEAHAQSGLVYLRKRFPTPGKCLRVADDCHFVVGNTWTFTQVFLNGHSVGYHGVPGTNRAYSATYSIRTLLPTASLKANGSLNEIIIASPKTVTNSDFHFRMAPPIGIMSALDSLLVFYAYIGGTVILPVISCFTLLFLALLTLLTYQQAFPSEQLVRRYAIYCLVAGLFGLSLSRIPRIFLPENFISPLHRLLRTLSDFTYLHLACSFSSKKQRVVKPMIVFFTGLIALNLCELATGLTSDSVLYRFVFGKFTLDSLSTTSILATLFSGIALVAIDFPKYEDMKERNVILSVLLSVFLVKLYDMLAYSWILPEFYFGRFYNIFVGFSIGYLILRRRLIEEKTLSAKALFVNTAREVAHDIRSPLTTLQMAASSLRTDANHRQVDLILRASERLRNISDDLLETTKLRASSRIDVAHELIDILEQKKTEHQNKIAIDWKYFIDPNIAQTISLDRTTFFQIVSNLLNNSVEALKEGRGEIQVRLCKRKNGVLAIRIADNGQGIEKLRLKRIRRGNPETSKVKGNGIGLPATIERLKIHNAVFVIKSSIRRGTIVRLHLPHV